MIVVVVPPWEEHEKKGLVDLHKYRNEEDDEEIKSLLSIEDEFAEAKMVENLGFI